ncbi:MAG TPA: prephenate dehydrogenase/arogenate dehydrogenase family protein, partial [candidate division Zixibacteria bacterium]|nr:prephenate dehydrogenase/arogenate dehydrogenase family protein [candidate division Zixibacteria bacterium]
MDKLAFPGKRIAIIGLGLMGGSLAMSLHGKCDDLFGVDRDPETVKYARKLNIFTQVATSPEEILAQSNVVILATPVGTIVNLIQKLPDIHPGSAIVMDIGSTKQEILEAYQALPPRFIPIGGHPMCGKEKSSIAHADPAIFDGAVFALSSLERTSQEVCEFADQLVRAIGSKPVWVGAETHDRWVALISHLPYLLSLSLALATPDDAKTLSGPGYNGMV